MSFLTNYEDDIFISYAHLDNVPDVHGKDGWITFFNRALQARITKLLGIRELSIWRDPKLTGNDYFGDKLLDKLSKMAVFISIISPSYINSEWCKRELAAFYDNAERQGALRIGQKSRIFKAVKTYVPLARIEEHLPQVKGMTGYEFYKLDSSTGRAREFPYEVGPGVDLSFMEKLEDLAQDLAQLLDTLKSSENAPPQSSESFSSTRATAADASRNNPATASITGNGNRASNNIISDSQYPADANASPTSGATIYLAETSTDMSLERDKIKRELQQRGHNVLPDEPLPLIAPEIQNAVRDDLERSKLSVHLIGANYGIVPEAAEESIVCLQNEIAAEVSHETPLTRLIWMPPGLQPKEERQQQFVNSLQSDRDAQKGAEVLQTSLEDLKTYIQDKLKPPPPTASADATVSGDAAAAPLRIYLVTDQQDYDAIAPLQEYLFNQGFEVILPAMEGSEAEVREDHKQNLLLCDAVIIYYGNTKDIWLNSKLGDLRKIAGYGRTMPMLAKAIYVGSPPTSQKQRLMTREALIIRGAEQFSPDPLKPFLDIIVNATRSLS